MTGHSLNYGRCERQAEVLSWVRSTFGPESVTVGERILRFLEEAIELAQAEDVPVWMARRLLEHVYSKLPGDPCQEAGGVGVTLLAYCEAAHICATQAEIDEFRRVKALPVEHLRARHNLKAGAGIAVRVPTSPTNPAEQHLATASAPNRTEAAHLPLDGRVGGSFDTETIE